MWGTWKGDLEPLRNIYIGMLDSLKEKDPDENKVVRANKAVAHTLIYKVLFNNTSGGD